MAEIKKINGNTLCDDTARDAANTANSMAGSAMSQAQQAATKADTANEVAEHAHFVARGIARTAKYDADSKRMLIKQWDTDSGSNYVEIIGGGMEDVRTIVKDEKSFAVQQAGSCENIVATCVMEDGMHVLSGSFVGSIPSFEKEVELTETVVPLSVQADWNESDPASAAYVKNRIGGYKRSEEERKVVYDEATAEYIDVDLMGSGQVDRYRKASDTLTDWVDWFGAKIVIDMNGEDMELVVGEDSDLMLDIVLMEYEAGKLAFTVFNGQMVCGIIAPQDTDITKPVEQPKAKEEQEPQDPIIVPKGVWVLDLPWMAEIMASGASVDMLADSESSSEPTTMAHKSITLSEYRYIDGDNVAVTVGHNNGDVAQDLKFMLEQLLIIAESKLNSASPVATGAFSLGRKNGTEVGMGSFAAGYNVTAKGPYSHAEGFNTTAIGSTSHAEGDGTTASMDASHAEGNGTKASARQTHAEGYNTIASGENQHVQGKHNIADTTSAHIVGNGTSDTARSNAHTLDWSGNAWFAGDVYVGSTSGTNKDEGSVKLVKESDISSEDWTFTLESGETVTKKVVLG